MGDYYQKTPQILAIRNHFFTYSGLILISLIFSSLGCKESPQTVSSTYAFIKPSYRNIRLEGNGDTLNFRLSKNTYNEIKCFNYFEDKGVSYLSIYDRRSESICIYNFSDQHRAKKVYLKKAFRNQSMYKTSVYTKNFDSIFVTNNHTLYLIDSAGTRKSGVDFYPGTSEMAFFENQVPVVFKNNRVYMAVRPYVDESSPEEIKRWRLIYGFDMQKKLKETYYQVPPIYTTNSLNDRFFAFGYCFNDKGNFVFSFPADTNIYETNLVDYHKAYYGKSRFQVEPFVPISLKEGKGNDSRKQYMMRDTYGPIYYDSYNKRYLRVAWQKITEEEYESDVRRTQSVIVFDENFKVISELEVANQIFLTMLFFADKGKMYVMTNTDDENALHFERLVYSEKQDEPLPVAINNVNK